MQSVERSLQLSFPYPVTNQYQKGVEHSLGDPTYMHAIGSRALDSRALSLSELSSTFFKSTYSEPNGYQRSLIFPTHLIKRPAMGNSAKILFVYLQDTQPISGVSQLQSHTTSNIGLKFLHQKSNLSNGDKSQYSKLRHTHNIKRVSNN